MIFVCGTVFWISTIFTITAFSVSVFGLWEPFRDLIVEAYRADDIGEKYSMLELEIQNDESYPCLQNKFQIPDLAYIGFDKIDIRSKIEYGDVFAQQNGHVLIVDEVTTIDIPAIIKCIPTYKNGSAVKFNNKEVIYYLLMFWHQNETKFGRVIHSEKYSDNNKIIYIFSEIRTIMNIKETYKSSQSRKPVKFWFNKWNDKKTEGKKQCEKLAILGQMKEATGATWEIIDGNIKAKLYDLILSLITTVQIHGVIECVVNVKELNDYQHTEKRYFTIAKISGNKTTQTDQMKANFCFLFGPKKIKEKYIFALNEGLLTIESENQTSIRRTRS